MQKKHDVVDRDFFKKPFSPDEIANLLLGRSAAEMFNPRSPSFKALGLDREKLTEGKMIEWMLKEPRLIRRPIVEIGGKVYFGADIKLLADVLGEK